MASEYAEDRRDHDEQQELSDMRQKCMQTIRSRIGSSKVLGDADMRIYEEEVLSDKGLARAGKIFHRDKIAYIREVEQKLVPELLAEAQKIERNFLPKVEEAKRNGWISEQSANRWTKRLCDGSVAFHKKHLFVTADGNGATDVKSFLSFMKNWEAVAEKAKQLREHKEIKKLTLTDVPQFSTFMNHKQFLNLSFKNREALVKTVDAALTAKEKEMPQLYEKAKVMLNSAVQRQALSSSKVGGWLERIFKSSANAKQIEQFLNNSGSNPLQKLIQNWSEASKHFHKLEAKRKSLGTPPGFHFVTMNVFLDWKYDKRTSYLEEAEHRFADINKEPSLFLKIRHELGAKDWEAAEELLMEAEKEEWGTENQKKLQSMKTFLRQHRSDKGKDKNKEKQNPSPDQVLAEMESLMAELPWQLQRTYIKALNKGYQAFWALTTLMYNRVWCHQHNFLDKGKEKVIEKKAKDETQDHIDRGHKKFGFEANYLRDRFSDQREAVRNQSGVKGAQILYTDHKSDSALVDEIDEQKNDRNFWYWTSMIPEDVEYTKHLYVVQRLNPRMKKLARMMENMGIRYPLSFDAEDAQPEYVAAKR